MLKIECVEGQAEIGKNFRVAVSIQEVSAEDRTLRIDIYDEQGYLSHSCMRDWVKHRQDMTLEVETSWAVASGLYLVCGKFVDFGDEAADRILLFTSQDNRNWQSFSAALSFLSFGQLPTREPENFEALERAAIALHDSGCWRASASVWMRIASHWLDTSSLMANRAAGKMLVCCFSDEVHNLGVRSYYMDPCLALSQHLTISPSTRLNIERIRDTSQPLSVSVLHLMASVLEELEYREDDWKQLLKDCLSMRSVAAIALPLTVRQFPQSALESIRYAIQRQSNSDDSFRFAFQEALDMVELQDLLDALPQITVGLSSEQQQYLLTNFKNTFPLSWVPDDIYQEIHVQYVMCRGLRFRVTQGTFDVLRPVLETYSLAEVQHELEFA